MKIGCWCYYEELSRNNFLFDNSDTTIGDGLLKPFNELFTAAGRAGIELLTLDLLPDPKAADAYLFLDYPDMRNELVRAAMTSSSPKYLVTFESEVIRRENWLPENHQPFEKVFTWNDDLVDNRKYIKINFSHVIPPLDIDLRRKQKFCTLIAGRKTSDHPLELYSERLACIRWFEKHHPELFDLYGFGWDDYTFPGSRYINMLRKNAAVRSITPRPHRCYRGSIAKKRPVLERYRFAICYENARDITGYITEKIFDCFFALCVPVYWGAPNITDHIPAKCFIDKKHFSSLDGLYTYLSQMNQSEYGEYVNSIRDYLTSDRVHPFTTKCFTETLLQEMAPRRHP